MGATQVRILGPIEADVSGRPVELGRPRQRALLALLVTRANTVVSTGRLVDLLWGLHAPARPEVAIQVYVSGLRRALEPARKARGEPSLLLTRSSGYLLEIDADDIDAARFEELAGEGHRLLTSRRPVAAREVLRRAMALWRGPPLEEFSFAPFADPEAARLEELRSAAIEDRLEAEMEIGENPGLVAQLEALTADFPLRERLWALLMVALYRAGRQADALRAFGRARAVLAEELGVEPGPALRRLEADILHQDPALEARMGPALAVSSNRTAAEPRDAVTETAPQRRSTLVGRQWQIGMLEATLTTARSGQTQVVLVSGEPGIGKTRLVEELAVTAADLRTAVAWGRCCEAQGVPPFWPWVQVVRELITNEGLEAPTVWSDGLMAIAQIVPELAADVLERAHGAVVDAAEARSQLYDAVAGVLERAAAVRPLLVVLDDIHWADVGSLELAEFVAEHVPRAPLLFVCTYRDVDPAIGHPLAGTLEAMARRRVHRLPLSGLDQDGVRELMAQAGVDVGDDTTAAVYARTDGNPFFVTELARRLATEPGMLAEQASRLAIPAGVDDVIRDRLARLPYRTRELLAMASVLGRNVDVRLLAAAEQCQAAEALALVDAAVAVGILVRDWSSVGRHSFSHALVQETVYQHMDPVERATRHAQAARAIRSVLGDDPSHANELADHLYQAAPAIGPDQGIDAAIRAAEVAQERLSYEQAEQQLRRALELGRAMPPGPERSYRELDLQHRLAALLSSTQGYHAEVVAAAWQRAREIGRELGDTPEVLVSIWGLARVARARGQLELVLRLGDELLELGKDSPWNEFLAAGHETCGIGQLFRGDFHAAARHLSLVAAAEVQPTADGGSGGLVMHPGVVCGSYLAIARWLLGEDEHYELADRALALALATQHPTNEAVARLIGCMGAILQADAPRALAWGESVVALSEYAGLGTLGVLGGLIATWGRAYRDGPASVMAAIDWAVAELNASGWRLAWTFLCGMRADVLRLAGDLEGALDLCEEGLRDVERRAERFYEAELCRLRGELTLALWPERTTDAATWFERAVEVANGQSAVTFGARAARSLAAVRGKGPSCRPVRRGE